MRVFLDQIRDDKPYVLNEHMAQSDFDALLDGYESHRAESGLDVSLTLRLINGARVIVDGRLTGRVSAPCVLCLEPVEYPLDVEVMVTFMPESERARFMAASEARDRDDDDGVELESDELDVMFYGEAAIDLEPVVRESVLLELQSFPRHDDDDPQRPEDCVDAASRLGGQDESRATDDGEAPIDPRWAGLLELKNKNRDPDAN